MSTNVIEKSEQISPLQIEVRDKLREVADRKQMKNADLARFLSKSESVISEILNDKKPFSQRLLNEVNSNLNDFFIQKEGLIPVLRQYDFIRNVVKTCKSQQDFRLLVGNTGIGKSVTLRQYNQETSYVYYFKIDRQMSWKVLLKKLCGVLGISTNRMNQYDLYDAIELFFKERSSHQPMLIMDETEMLPLEMWLRVKGMFTTLEGMVSLLMCCTPDYKNKLARKAGLDEETWFPNLDQSNVYTTLARRLKIFNVKSVTSEDVMDFFRARGVRNEKTLQEASVVVWNYDQADKLLKKAQRMGFDLKTLTADEFSVIKIN